jgi:hypothetical protein
MSKKPKQPKNPFASAKVQVKNASVPPKVEVRSPAEEVFIKYSENEIIDSTNFLKFFSDQGIKNEADLFPILFCYHCEAKNAFTFTKEEFLRGWKIFVKDEKNGKLNTNINSLQNPDLVLFFLIYLMLILSFQKSLNIPSVF